MKQGHQKVRFGRHHRLVALTGWFMPCLVCILALLHAPLTWATLYKVIDANGRVTYTDQPPIAQPHKKLALPASKAPQPSEAAAVSPHKPSQSRAVQQGGLTVYGTTRCGYCRALRADLQQRSIAYTFKDVETDAEARQQFENLGGEGVPLTTYKNLTYRGYRADGFASFLSESGLQ